MIGKFPKSARLLLRKEYQKVYREGVRHVGKYIVADSIFKEGSNTRLGITTSRKYGNAVVRNRFRRILREAYRQNIEFLPRGMMINIRPRIYAKRAKTNDIAKELITLFSDKNCKPKNHN